jgi:MinD superfamily P-loop ATPase
MKMLNSYHQWEWMKTEVCRYNAIALIKEKILFFKNLCHICGACLIVCPEDAIIQKTRKIGELKHGKSGNIDFHYALLETGEGGMSPRLIKKVKEYTGEGINILDSSPGTSCSVVETVKDADLCVLVTDPTPFGIHDLKLAVDMCRKLNSEPVIIVNRAEYLNNDLKSYCKEEQLEIIGEIPDERKIAECYSIGNLVVEQLSEYYHLFKDIVLKIIKHAREKREVLKKPYEPYQKDTKTGKIVRNVSQNKTGLFNGKELVVISGKGGTGKTSLVASFCALEKSIAISDCDVDAADLHLVLAPQNREKGFFSGGEIAEIDMEKCTGCGACLKSCRFEAIQKESVNGKAIYRIDDMACEGCGVCGLVCKYNAVSFKTAINGEWFISETRFGPMSHARLGIAEENSGKLASLIRDKKNELAASFKLEKSMIDGSPGTGCPVIASITGTDYALVVTEPTVSGIHDLKRILDVINFFKIRSGIIVNKYDLNPEKTQEIKEVAKQYSSDFLGIIPYNKSVTKAQMKGLSVVEYTDNSVTKKITEIWNNLKNDCFNEREGR